MQLKQEAWQQRSGQWPASPQSTQHINPSSLEICPSLGFPVSQEQAEELLNLQLAPAAQQRPFTCSSHSSPSAVPVLPQTAPSLGTPSTAHPLPVSPLESIDSQLFPKGNPQLTTRVRHLGLVLCLSRDTTAHAISPSGTSCISNHYTPHTWNKAS